MAPRGATKKSKEDKGKIKDPVKDARGKICNWDSRWVDAKTLAVLVECGTVTGMTPGQIQQAHEQFAKYANSTLSSAVSALRTKLLKEVDAARGSGSSVLHTHSNLRSIAEDASYNSALDPDWEAELSSQVSALGMEDDEYSYDTITKGGYTKVSGRLQRRSQQKKVTIHGNLKVGLPYILDIWRDHKNQRRISLQIQLLSGQDFFKKVFFRVSKSKAEGVLSFPMNEYMKRADFAFETFVLDEMQLSEQDKNAMKVVLKHHSKTAARMDSVAKTIAHCQTGGFFYEQRFPLPVLCKHEFAAPDGDEFFCRKRFVQYPDGSVHLHVELLAETSDSYRPVEAKSVAVVREASSPSRAAMPPPGIPTMVGGGRAPVLQETNAYNPDPSLQMQSPKCRCATATPPTSPPAVQRMYNLGPHEQTDLSMAESFEEQSITSAEFNAASRQQQQQQQQQDPAQRLSLYFESANTLLGYHAIFERRSLRIDQSSGQCRRSD